MITLTYGVTSIELKNPELGNSESVDVKTKFRRSMSGDQHSFISTPELRLLNLQFVELGASKYAELLTFLEGASGQEIDYTDFEDVEWAGHIMAGTIEFQATKNGYNVAFVFEGSYEQNTKRTNYDKD